MKLPRFTLRDLLWLTLVVGLVLALIIRERQTIDLVEHRDRMDSLNVDWQWSFQTLAEEHARKTGAKATGLPARVLVVNPDGTMARKDRGDNAWAGNR